MRTKSRKVIEKEKKDNDNDLPSTGEYWEAQVAHDTTSKKISKCSRIYICKECGMQFNTRRQVLTHIRRHKRIKRIRA